MNGNTIPMKMNEDLEQLLKNLKLGRILDIYPGTVARRGKRRPLLHRVSGFASCAPSGMRARKTPWNGVSAVPTCPNSGRWKPFPSLANAA